jgi:flagellar basal-body rod protein FlgC
MSGSSIFSIIGSALNAQDARMGAIASNLANVDSITAPGGVPYRAHEVVFQADPASNPNGGTPDAGTPGAGTPDAGTPDASGGPVDSGVAIAGTVLSNAPLKTTYDPGSPYADNQGYVTGSNVSQVSQMVDLVDSSNSYAASVAVLQQASRVDQQMLSSFQVS